jgi:predicted DNA-binding transcriptional regulator AlpA
MSGLIETIKLTMKQAEIAERTGMSVRTIQRMVKAGLFPPPTCRAGKKVPMWSHDVIRAWAEGRWQPAPRPAGRKPAAAGP